MVTQKTKKIAVMEEEPQEKKMKVQKTVVDSPEKVKKTKIVVKYDCGIQNSLYIRGEGVSTLSWEKGAQLQNITANEWIWETERPFTTLQCKVLVNDAQYEQGENHTVSYGKTQVINPQF